MNTPHWTALVIFYVISLHTVANHSDDKHYHTAVNIINVLYYWGEPERAPHWSNGVPRYLCTIAVSKIKGTAREIYRIIISLQWGFSLYTHRVCIQGKSLRVYTITGIHYATSAQSWPHDGVWPTFQKKNRRGRIK